MTNYIHRAASSKKLRSVILGMNYVSGSFPPYSKHSSVKYYWHLVGTSPCAFHSAKIITNNKSINSKTF